MHTISEVTDLIDKIEKIIQDHEKRISELEKRVFVEKIKPKEKQEFEGLSGGIEFLISKGFLDAPKSVKEIQEELKKEGYHYPYSSINKLLSVNFMAKQKRLTRISEGKVWKYVLRK
jgi:hypothetical protein